MYPHLLPDTGEQQKTLTETKNAANEHITRFARLLGVLTDTLEHGGGGSAGTRTQGHLIKSPMSANIHNSQQTFTTVISITLSVGCYCDELSFFGKKCDKFVTRPPTPDGVPPPLLILKISESSNFFPEKIQDLSPGIFTSIFTVLFFNVETLKSMSSIIVAMKLMLNTCVG